MSDNYSWQDRETNIVTTLNLLWTVSETFEKVEFFKGDLVRDVFWMQRHYPKLLADLPQWSFYFGCRNTGTSIGYDCDLVDLMSNDNLLKCTYSFGKWDGTYGMNVEVLRP